MQEMACFADLIILSKTLLKCGASWGLKCQSKPWLDFIRWIWLWSSWLTNSFISFSFSTKLVPLSLNSFVGHPLRAAIRTKAFRKATISSEAAISKWQQWVCRYRNKQRYRLQSPSTPLNCKVWSGEVHCAVREWSCCHLETYLWQWSH